MSWKWDNVDKIVHKKNRKEKKHPPALTDSLRAGDTTGTVTHIPQVAPDEHVVYEEYVPQPRRLNKKRKDVSIEDDFIDNDSRSEESEDYEWQPKANKRGQPSTMGGPPSMQGGHPSTAQGPAVDNGTHLLAANDLPVQDKVPAADELQPAPVPQDSAMFATAPTVPDVAGAAPVVMRVTIPAGVTPGQKIDFRMPDGRTASVVVPPGVLPGQVMGVNVPDAPAAE